MCLNFCRPLREHAHAALQAVVTPLETSSRVRALSSHPDQALVKYVSDGLREGFRLGFKWDSPLRSTRSNMQPARLHPQIITDYLQKELSLGRVLGPFTADEVPHGTHINRIGVIPMSENTMHMFLRYNPT